MEHSDKKNQFQSLGGLGKLVALWRKVNVQWRLHLLIQLSLIAFFVASQNWIINKFDEFGIKDIKAEAIETSDGLINGLNLLMVTGQIFYPDNRVLLLKKMSSSSNVKELYVARAEQVNAQFGPGLPSEVPRDDKVRQVLKSATPVYFRERTADGVPVLRAIIPFVASENFRGTNCLECHHVAVGSANGAADIRMDLSTHELRIAQLKQWLWSGMLLFQIALSGLIAIFVRVILNRHIAEPVKKLQLKLEDICNSGDLSLRVPLDKKHPDINSIAHSVNLFISNLEEATKESNLLAKVVESSEEAILITDEKQDIVFVNEAFEKITGFSYAEVIGRNPRILKSGLQDAAHYQNMWKSINTTGSWKGEIYNRRKNGQIFPEWQSVSAVKDEHGVVTNYYSLFMDITQRKASEEHISRMANFDTLTGLANRNLLNDRLSQALFNAHRKHTKLAVLFLDLDNFKHVNDGHGHSAGDDLLKTVARRLVDCVREGDTVARQGGDEFILLLPNVEGTQGVTKVAEKILNSVAAPYQIAGHEMHVSVSIGIGIYPDDGTSAEAILRNADTAMYNAKQDGRDCYRLFTPDMTVAAQRRYKLQSKLRYALKQGELELYYQPQFSNNAGEITGVEALLRWRDPVEGFISPAEFIPLAEDSGQITVIGLWVLQQACRDVKKWRDQGFDLTVSVNVSGRQFRENTFDSQVVEALKMAGLEAKYLELEMTEGVLIEQDEMLSNMMDKLKAIGVRLALDDFGTGYSSLSYIKKFPIDRIKIDQAFVHDVISDSEDAAIVDAIIYIAHKLDIEVIAEGVETLAQLEFLREHNCHDFQGYYISLPLPTNQLVAVFNEFRERKQAKK